MRIRLFLFGFIIVLGSLKLWSQDYIFFYRNSNVPFAYDKSQIDSLSFKDSDGQLQDSLYLMVANEVIFRESLDEIDSITFSSEEGLNLAEKIALDKDFSLFNKALVATGLNKQITKHIDHSYIAPEDLIMQYDGWVQGHGILTKVPKERKFGYTALMESDETYAKLGVYNLDDLKVMAKSIYDKKYPEDAEITDLQNPKNSLYRFVAYHLINKKISKELFVDKFDNTGSRYEMVGETHSIRAATGHGVIEMCEYIETMCPNSLIEVRTYRVLQESNVFNVLAGGRAIRLTENYNNFAINGVYHEIDNVLSYSMEVDQMLKSKRLRMDIASFFPELTNNDMRVGHEDPDWASINYIYPEGYIERLKVSKNINVGYINSDDRFCDYQGDELFLTHGLYEMEITTPPIPDGTYEVRMGFTQSSSRGVAQFYWDNLPVGIPRDLRLKSDDPDIGWLEPGKDPMDPFGYRNDKVLRNHGFMKAPASFTAINKTWYTGNTARHEEHNLRMILGTFTFDQNMHHTLRVKAVRSGQFMIDYLEFVPVEEIENEDIY